MNQKLWLLACLFMSVAVILGACSPAPAPTEAPTQVSQPQPTQAVPPTEAVVSTAAPTSANSNQNPDPYPAPAVAVEYITTIDPYPAPPSGEKIEWSEVAALLAAGQVADVFQSHTLLVILNMKDGTSYVATEPAKDEIFKLLDQCGEACLQVKRVSEFFY